jgi:hypothetical protein
VRSSGGARQWSCVRAPIGESRVERLGRLLAISESLERLATG